MNITGNNMRGVSMSTSNGVTKVTINGKTTVINGGSVSIKGNQIYVNNLPYEVDGLTRESNVVYIKIEGNVETVGGMTEVTVNGNVNSKLISRGSVTVNGDVYNRIDASGSVIISGNQQGEIKCDGSVIIGKKSRW